MAVQQWLSGHQIWRNRFRTSLRLTFMLLTGLFLNACSTTDNTSVGTPLSPETVTQSVKDTLKLLNEVYVYPERAKTISQEISRRLDAGVYADISTKEAFVSRLKHDLQQISGDYHLGLSITKEQTRKPGHRLKETVDKFKNNFAFERVEVLPGNIGYLKFNKFYHTDDAKKVLDHAFAFLSSTDAIIIDLSDNKGGSPMLVEHMASHFFTDKTHLWTVYDRDNAVFNTGFTEPGIGVKHFKANLGLYLITSANTASAAESFAYALKHYGKATIVGQTTMGIAHLVSGHKINSMFTGRLSVARPVHPLTKTDWEGKGVIPDIKVALTDNAIETARLEALKRLKTARKK